MAAFDWQTFLDRNGIEYATGGKSTAKGNLYVHCPFCGNEDQGRHMGISEEGRGWGCWKNRDHRGIAPGRLIKALTGCSWDEVGKLLGSRFKPVGDLLGAVKDALGEPEDQAGEGLALHPLLELPDQFKALTRGSPHYEYLRSGRARNFTHNEIDFLKRKFRLRQVMYSKSHWRWRMVIPVYGMDRELQTWTARAVGKANLRYRSLSTDLEKEQPDAGGLGQAALLPITDCMLGAHRLRKGGRFLILTEGFFDSACFSLESVAFEARESCLFGKNISPAQLDMLAEIRHLYGAVFLLLDPDARVSAMRMTSELTSLGVQMLPLEGEDDPGDMGAKAIRRLLRRMENRISRNRK